MIKKVTLTQVDLYEKKKDGTPLTFVDKKTGEKRRYKKIRIGIQGMKETAWGAVWSSDSPLNHWERDMEVTIDLYQDEKGFWNFKLPNKDSELRDMIEDLKARVSALEKDVYEQDPAPQTAPATEELGDLEDDIKAEDLPF